MYKNIKKNEGLTLVTVIVSVLIMVIISTMLVLRASDSIEADRLNRMNNEIKNLQDNILVYYAKNGQIPEKGLYTGTNNDFKNYKNINDNENYYIIDVNKLDNVILKNGKGNWSEDSSTDDVYVVNEATLKVYYVKGVKVSGKMYYTLNQGETVNIDKSDLVNSKNKLTIEKGYGIANTPELKTGMIPVVWNESSNKWEEVKDTTNDYWYDYANNMPANMTLQDGSIYVWIPRYGISNDTIKFVDNENEFYSNDEIYEAESVFGNLSGIWVAKYEASRSDASLENEGTSLNIKIEGNVKKWTGATEDEKEAKCKNIVLLGTNGLDKAQVKTSLITFEYKTTVIQLLNKTNMIESQYSIMKETSADIVDNTQDFSFRPIIIPIETSEAQIIPTPSKWDANIVSETRQGNVPVPNGFYYVGGTKKSGFTISDSKKDENKGGNYPISGLDGNQFVWKSVENIDDWNDSNTSVYIYNTNGYISYIESLNKELVENNNLENVLINNQSLKESIQEYSGYYASLNNQNQEILRIYIKPSKSIEIYYYDNNTIIQKQIVILNNQYENLYIPTKEGYSFEGWYADLNHTTQITNSTLVTNSNNHNLYAKWKLNSIEVTYYDNTSVLGNKTVTVGNQYGDLLQPTKYGYNFEGWYTDTNYSTQITSTTVVTNSNNHNLYAKWSLIIYTVYFEKPTTWNVSTGIYLHSWGDTTGDYKSWLSNDEKMTLVSGNTYSFQLPMIYNKMCFVLNSTTDARTSNTTLNGNNLTYRVPNTGTVYFQNPSSDWPTPPHAYTWISGSETNNAAWPGIDMTLVDSSNRYYSYNLLSGHNMIIFNSKNKKPQTEDLSIPNLNVYDMIYLQEKTEWRYWVTSE